MRTFFLFFILTALALAQAPKQQAKGQAKNAFAGIDWNAPFPAHKIVGNVYFVG